MECQKLHWKVVHKIDCAEMKSSRNLMRDLGAKGQTREIGRWMNAWYPAVVVCAPIALDLANHEWGHHDTHTYVPFDVNSQIAHFLI